MNRFQAHLVLQIYTKRQFQIFKGEGEVYNEQVFSLCQEFDPMNQMLIACP